MRHWRIFTVLSNTREIMDGAVELALVRLWSGRLNDAEAAAIRSRAAADAGYRERYLGALKALAGLRALAGDDDIQAIAAETRTLGGSRASNGRAALGIAASMLLGAGLAAFYFTYLSGANNERLERHFTRVGEQKTLELDDGSVVTLNTGTRLVVDYTGAARTILLERGEAFFEVAEDPARPFTVELGARSVTAIGTAFSVRKHLERYQLAVLEGRVLMHLPGADSAAGGPSARPGAVSPARRIVEQGWVAEFDTGRSRLTAFRPESMERYLGWRTGMLRFDREPLYRVVQELNRYTRKNILIEDAAVMELSVYAAVSVNELGSALHALEQLLAIEITEHYDQIVITGSEGIAPAPGGGS